jgi:hypothetical protein
VNQKLKKTQSSGSERKEGLAFKEIVARKTVAGGWKLRCTAK